MCGICDHSETIWKNFANSNSREQNMMTRCIEAKTVLDLNNGFKIPQPIWSSLLSAVELPNANVIWFITCSMFFTQLWRYPKYGSPQWIAKTARKLATQNSSADYSTFMYRTKGFIHPTNITKIKISSQQELQQVW